MAGSLLRRADDEDRRRLASRMTRAAFNLWAESYGPGFPTGRECRDAVSAIRQDLGIERIVPAARQARLELRR